MTHRTPCSDHCADEVAQTRSQVHRGVHGRENATETADPVASRVPSIAGFRRSHVPLLVLVGTLILAILSFALWRGLPSRTPAGPATTASSTQAPPSSRTATPAKVPFCLMLASVEVYNPQMLDHMILYSTWGPGLSDRLRGVISAYQGLQNDGLSAEVSDQLGTMIALATAWKSQSDSAGLASAQGLYRDEREAYAAAYAALAAFSQAMCPA